MNGIQWPVLTAASSFARDLNGLVFFLFSISIFFIVLISVLIAVFVVRYRRTPANLISREVRTRPSLEVLWTLVPLSITILAFSWGARQFLREAQIPERASEVTVLGRQWMWKFRSDGGAEEINELHLPVHRAVRLTMISQDVIHSFFIPDLRVKYDVLPGRYTQLWFEPDRVGNFPILCTQYCGTDHSKMIGRVIIMSETDFQDWQKRSAQRRQEPLTGELTTDLASDRAPGRASDGTTDLAAARGGRLFHEKACDSCHREQPIGPSLDTVPQSWVSLEGTSQPVLADDSYLRDSILEPSRQIVHGYRDVMPSFKGQLNEEEILDLIQYIKQMKAGHS